MVDRVVDEIRLGIVDLVPRAEATIGIKPAEDLDQDVDADDSSAERYGQGSITRPSAGPP